MMLHTPPSLEGLFVQYCHQHLYITHFKDSHEGCTGPSQEEGLILLSVEKDSAAKKAGLLMGDIIVKFDDKPITNIHDLRRQLLKNIFIYIIILEKIGTFA
jgi:S1-C subfamily serine protease